MDHDKYILNDQGEPEPCDDLMVWGKTFRDKGKRRVDATEIGESRVSTVFLGLDHGYGNSEPVLWETLVFNGPMDGEMDRCSGSRIDAQKMHDRMVLRVTENHSLEKLPYNDANYARHDLDGRLEAALVREAELKKLLVWLADQLKLSGYNYTYQVVQEDNWDAIEKIVKESNG